MIVVAVGADEWLRVDDAADPGRLRLRRHLETEDTDCHLDFPVGVGIARMHVRATGGEATRIRLKRGRDRQGGGVKPWLGFVDALACAGSI